MLVICCDQIPFDMGVQRRLFKRIFLRFPENKTGAGAAQEVSDQHAARPVYGTVDWKIYTQISSSL